MPLEIAGVVLGALALAGPTYKLYKNCSQLILDIRNYEKGLIGCCHSIATQKGLYADTWTLTLSLVKVEKDLAAVMLEDENHPQWKDPDFLKLWTETIGSHFDAGVKVTQDTLKEIEEILSSVQQCQKSTKQGSFIKSSRSAVDRKIRKFGWGLKRKGDLQALINTLREQNQDLKHIYDQREALQRTPKPKFRELKSYRDPDLLLARLLAIREVSKTLYDSLAGVSTCFCHRVNLRLQFDVDGTPEPISDPKPGSPIVRTNGGLPAVIRSTKFRLIVTKEEGYDGPFSRPIEACSGTCMVITSELVPADSDTGGLRRPVTVVSQDDGLLQKCAQSADKVIQTSSRAVATKSDGGRVPNPEHGSEAGRLVTLEFSSQPAVPGGASAGRGGAAIATPLSKIPAESTAPGASIPPNSVAEIDSLCLLMQKLAPKSPTNHCLGLIKSCDTVRRHFIYCDQPSVLRTPYRKSLETILDEMALLQDDRLRISLTLSKSLLHLGSFSRSFFQERWRSRDIFFFFQALQTPLPTDTVGEPYVIPIFDKAPNSIEDEADGNDEAIASPARSEQLFSLALTLIEIGFGKRLWKIPSRATIPEKADFIAEYLKAMDILKTGLLERKMGLRFAQVVRRCLYCDFGIYEDDLSKKELQDIFYREVVANLERCLETHLRG
ncbi:unnamed protein product [Tuber aestivum]|uniref:DUF7580 domain-containing protein n=1 Tax=Tuber aestivum TaxID=59557 RepID=A0A292PRJ5_9PEZI|nr:unnamed protein product [Tuber aestivum]